MTSVIVYDVEFITYKESFDEKGTKVLTINIGNTVIELKGNYKIKFLEHIDDFFPKVKQIEVKIEEGWFFFTYYILKIDEYKVYVYNNSQIKVFNTNETIFEKSI